ncbi:MAG: deoxyribodipyrimidine photo-lyase [Methyloceanibacter sp.]
MTERPIIVWFRLDLRLADHAALSEAATTGAPLLALYILDDETPGALRMGGAARWWLHGSLAALGRDLAALGGKLHLRRGAAPEILAELLDETGASAIHATRGYEPWEDALERNLAALCATRNAELRLFPGRLLFEPETILSGSGRSFRVFTPFWKACLAAPSPRPPLPVPKLGRFATAKSETLVDFALLPANPDWAGGLRAIWQPGASAAEARLRHFIAEGLARYANDRGNLDGDPSSRLSPHLHFGEIGPNQVWHAVTHEASAARGRLDRGAFSFLRELGWREFSYHLLDRFPDMTQRPLKPEFARFPWRDDPGALRAWQLGETGYPIVDAAMRQLWQTGWMPNRARMIVASFLVKHLLVSWQAGAAWFLDTLVDADLANNSASWQWVAGTGTDAAPYFRIFNPVLQGRKFDPSGDYVRRFVPELERLPAPDIHAPWEAPALTLAEAGVSLGRTYPAPIVEHGFARTRALQALKAIRAG